MSDLGAIDADVVFDYAAASTLASACRTAASLIDGQGGERASAVQTGQTEFRGHFSDLFKTNAATAAGDALELSGKLREVAGYAEQLRDEARKEQQRRETARAWKKEHDNRNVAEKILDWGTGGDDPPVGPPATPLTPSVSAPSNQARQPLVAAGGSGSAGGGTSSAKPQSLRTFASTSQGANDILRPLPARLRADYAAFQAGCQWGSLEASGVFSGFDAWLAANDNDVEWATAVANAFK
ncbi:MAG: hypothetical protein ACRYG2_33420, partial [Janthinobacterium lividum]